MDDLVTTPTHTLRLQNGQIEVEHEGEYRIVRQEIDLIHALMNQIVQQRLQILKMRLEQIEQNHVRTTANQGSEQNHQLLQKGKRR
jgi:hypothetical protein